MSSRYIYIDIYLYICIYIYILNNNNNNSSSNNIIAEINAETITTDKVQVIIDITLMYEDGKTYPTLSKAIFRQVIILSFITIIKIFVIVIIT